MVRKIGSAGRFGARYGKKVRSKVAEIEKIQKKKFICPKCKMPYVKRIAKGIWYCEKCKTKFTSQAYQATSKLKEK